MTIKTFVLTPDNISRMWAQVKDAVKVISEKKPVKITVEPYSQRTTKQNRYYWGVVIPCVRAMFLDAGQSISSDDCHEYLKRYVMRLEKDIIGLDGKQSAITGSTTSLESGEFEHYMQIIRAWAAEYGAFIPLPNEEL